MPGVWVFRNGVVRLVDDDAHGGAASKKKALVHLPTGQPVSSHAVLEKILIGLGWERYYEDPDLIQFHKRSSIDLISLPKDFDKVASVNMYDVVIKNPNVFRVQDV